MPTLINTTVLSNFAAVERLDLLRVLWPILYVADSVYKELQAGLSEGYTFLAGLDAQVFPLHQDGWLRLVQLEGEEESAIYESIPPKLHVGEAISLAIAAHRGWLFLTDDRTARRYSAHLDVPVSGTLGILVRLVQQSYLDLEAGNQLLGQMIERARYQSPITNLRSVLSWTTN